MVEPEGAPSQRIGVVGGGTMGVGIVYVFAAAGFAVSLVEPDDVRAEAGQRILRETAEAGVKRGKLDTAKAQGLIERVRRRPSTLDLPERLDLVIETVSERLELKQTVLAEIASRRPALIATNTSALSIDVLARSVSDASSFLGRVARGELGQKSGKGFFDWPVAAAS
jgi:3-hydroxybutyryl-CoA dehydrogenase